MQKTTYYCDGCGAEKKQVNSWWMTDDLTSALTIYPFETRAVQAPSIKIYCGQQCVIKAVSEYMDQNVRSQP